MKMGFSNFFPIFIFSLCTRVAGVGASSSFLQSSALKNVGVCATVTTRKGEKFEFKEGATTPDADFQRLYKNLKNAVFSPVTSPVQCMLQICGFVSWADPYDPNYIGSPSDFAHCMRWKQETMADPQIFNENFTASSISCACHKNDGDCQFNCEDRKSPQRTKWKPNECAILFQDMRCEKCWFSPVALLEGSKVNDTSVNGSTFVTDNSHLIRSLVVRDGCRVKQEIPALKKMWRFRRSSGFMIYTSNRSSEWVTTTYLSGEPETFSCDCSAVPPGGGGGGGGKASKDWKLLEIILGTGGLFVAAAAFVTFLFWNRRKARGFQDAILGSSSSNTSSNLSTVSTSASSAGSLLCSSLPLETLAFDLSPKHLHLEQDQHHDLGQGQFGQVRLGTLQVAVKTSRVTFDPEDPGEMRERERSLLTEAKIMSKLGAHKNVLRLLGVVTSGSNGISLLMEYCENGSLKNFLATKMNPQVENLLRARFAQTLTVPAPGDGGYVQEKDLQFPATSIENSYPWNLEDVAPEILQRLLQFCQEIAGGMDFITSKKIVHVDLAARNVLLDHNLTAKICDFGMSMRIYLKEYEKSGKDLHVLPIRWMAPETLKQGRYTAKSDVWSFGVTIWEIFNLGVKDPFEEVNTLKELLAKIFEAEPLQTSRYAPSYVTSKIDECRRIETKRRPSFSDLEIFFEGHSSNLKAHLRALAIERDERNVSDSGNDN